jgi:hypothetical protein
MDFIQKIKDAKTIEGLFGIREFFSEYQQVESKNWLSIDKGSPNSAHLQNSQDANFYIKRVEAQIEYLQSKGVFLAQIELPNSETSKETSIVLEKC